VHTGAEGLREGGEDCGDELQTGERPDPHTLYKELSDLILRLNIT
jgi:hypothetical protein